MFKKKPQIKTSPLRSSDRRKLADQIISDFEVSVPTAQPNPTSDAEPNPAPHEQPSAPTLASIRASLVPENCLSARFTTTSGPTSTLVSGTVYVGAHPGQVERILWIQFSQDKRLYPTVYTLWQNPGIVPLLHTQDAVVDKLKGGADLMVPGLVGGPPWPTKARKDSVVAVAGLENPSVPVWTGVCEIDVSALGDVRGGKGRAVRGLHWFGDELWSWSEVTGQGGGEQPQSIPAWAPNGESETGIAGAMQELDLEDDDEDGQEGGGVALEEEKNGGQLGGENGTNSPSDEKEGGAEEAEQEPTTSEVDSAFYQAFLYSIHNAKKDHSPPTYGFEFPILPSFIISNMVQPHLRTQSQHYNIKKTSWKNAKKFIKHLDKVKLVKSKDRNGGETVILDIDFYDPQVTSFTPYKLPKLKPTESADNKSTSQPSSATADSSLNQSLNLITLIRPSPRLVPDLLPSKTSFYTPAQVSTALKTYISSNPDLTTNTSSARFIKLNPFLANNILNPTSPPDAKALAAGEIARDTLLRRILDDHALTPQYWVLLHADQSWDTDAADHSQLPKPRPSPAPRVTITLERRTGSKVVTRIAGLEAFGVNPSLLAPELQKKAAGAASVGQLVGGKPGVLEVTVQGDQRDVVVKELGRRGVKREWVEIVDKINAKKGGGGGGGGGWAGEEVEGKSLLSETDLA